MRYLSYLANGVTRLAVSDGDAAVDLQALHGQADIGTLLHSGADVNAMARQALLSAAPRLDPATLRLAPPVTRPGKIICLGLNYYEHAKESGRTKPQYPWLFLRATSSLIGHGAVAIRPSVSTQLDYEAELAVVIGSRVPRHVARSDALAHVFGYSCFNDISVRDYQKRTGQWTIGKNFDATGAFGPELVTQDELPLGAAGLRIQSRLNGKIMQSASTSDMIWDVAETIALLSECMTLEPADVLVMGTPAGVGQSCTPPVWLAPGDEIIVEIDGVGLLRNRVGDEVPDPAGA